jgi:leucyl-tRNA synthetase
VAGPQTATESEPYTPLTVESHWQERWAEEGVFLIRPPEPGVTDAYVQVSCPFTSGEAHMGHIRSFTIGDSYARFRRARGDSVLFSMGFDAFGLPAELGAIANEITPQEWVMRCAERMRSQFDELGLSFDWSRTFVSSDPSIYQWTQWLFLLLLEQGLIYQREGPVDWCDRCQTVLANAQVENGKCWRCHQTTELRNKVQWYLNTGVYNEENFEKLDSLTGWNKIAIGTQRSLLGRVDGVEFELRGEDGRSLTVFARDHEEDGIAEGRFVLLSPNHPEIEKWMESEDDGEAGDASRSGGWLRDARNADQIPIVDTGHWVSAPDGSGRLPVWMSPTVDGRYGPTAVLGTPELDKTDEVIFERIETPMDPVALEKSSLAATPALRYKISDFPVSRQRAWGTPIPIVHCPDCGVVPVPRDQLPVRLPDNMAVSEAGSVLAIDDDFKRCECPKCGGEAERETDTMDCHMDTAWMECALAVPADERPKQVFDHPELSRWMPCLYIHGADTGGFILDERAVAKAMRDAGHGDFFDDGEPFSGILMHGMVHLDGRKMSKHLGNVVSPSELVERVGADAVRFGMMQAAAPTRNVNWDDEVMLDSERFLTRLCNYAEQRLESDIGGPDFKIDMEDKVRRRLARWCNAGIRKVTENLERLSMHGVTQNAMVMLARIEDFEKRVTRDREFSDEDREAELAALMVLVQLMAPITPHLAEELWQKAGHTELLAKQPWPESV